MKPETNLDPQDWGATRRLAHQMVDDLFDFQQSLRNRPVWKPIPDEAARFFEQPVPHQPVGESQTYQDFLEFVLPNQMGNLHPRFWGWVMGNGIPYAALADYLAAVLNPNMGGGEHIANYVERQVVDWCKEITGFPMDSSGILVSGGSMANLVGLAVARNVKAGLDVRQDGLVGAPQLTVYSSAETHSSNYKAIELLGIGKSWMRFIPVNQHEQIDIDALEVAIASDKAAGFVPMCIIGNAATTNTGAFDDLNRLADICEREGIWFHVDGAFGAMAALSDDLSPLVAGMERADSLAFDLHKLMYMPFEVACVLIRNFEDHVNTFAAHPDYLSHMPRGLAGGQHAWFGDLGLQLTRSFRALKVWMTVRAYGLDHFTHQIEQNVEQAAYLAARIQATARLELLADVPFNIVCFRYKDPAIGEDRLNDLNQEILMRLHERGLAVPSYTRIQGKFALRASITNHRTTRQDLDYLVEQVLAMAHEIQEEEKVTP
jgi:aromatic-L-amino-acid decarboxylase